MKYRKKPIVIDAVQATSLDVAISAGVIGWGRGESPHDGSLGYIETLEGRMSVTQGDFIITGIKGERYPCKPDIFEATYEAVEVPAVRE